MTDDIVKRLRNGVHVSPMGNILTAEAELTMDEAADEIAKLREERQELKNELAKWVHFWRDKDVKALSAANAKLRVALKPFAGTDTDFYAGEKDSYVCTAVWFSLGHYRAAKAALGESDE